MDAKVLIGVPTAEGSRHSSFYDYYHQLERPNNILHMFSRSQSPAKNRNIIIEAALSHECTHILFLDDDVVPPADILTKLMLHNKDVVTGIYPMRDYPHFPIIFDKRYDNGYNRFVHLKPEHEGLIEVTNCGFGCVLIKTEVFKKLEKPWVRLGELDADGWCDDIGFFNRVTDAGFKIYCDLDIRVGHMMTVYAGFNKVNGNWQVEYDVRGTGKLSFPIQYPEADISLAKRIRGWASDKELEFLGLAAKHHSVLLEVGSFCGKSTRAMADNLMDNGKILAVDPWNADLFDVNGELMYKTDDNIFKEFDKNLHDHIMAGNVIPHKMKFADFEPNGYKPDFIYIDAAHDYENVKHDIKKALSMNPKVISGHDYNWDGVKKAVDEWFGSNKIQTLDSIWWVELGAN